jgi:hypothetical protein
LPSQQTQAYRCPNCQTELGEPVSRCPRCGMGLQIPQQSQAFTTVPVVDAILGTLTGLIAIATGIGVIGAIVAYFQLRKRYPYFCMGLAISGTLLVLALLGLLLVCFGAIRT